MKIPVGFLASLSLLSPLSVVFLLTGSHVTSAQTPLAAQDAFNSVLNLINISDPPTGTGKAILKINAGNTNIQISNYGGGSFKLTNVGTKRIAAIFIDCTTAIFQDVNFDDDGRGGDSAAKVLGYDGNAGLVGAIDPGTYQWRRLPDRNSSFKATNSFDPNALSDVNNLFVDSTSDNSLSSPKAGGGYRGELCLFTDFGSSETVGFAGDMDGNSIAGLGKFTVDNGSGWDVGGVSGAEMANSVVTVLFGDGSTATGTIANDGSQGGGTAVITNGLQGPPSLTVNGLGPGDKGSYNSVQPTVVVAASPGSKVRVSLVKGINPVVNSKLVGGGQITVRDLVQARLSAQYPWFPANNAKEWQHITIQIPLSGSLDISSSFSYGTEPIAYTAVIIDSNGDPSSETVNPIYLLYSSGPVAPIAPTPTVPIPAPIQAPVTAPIQAPIPAPTLPTQVGQVVGLNLIQAGSNTIVASLFDGAVVNLNGATPNFNVDAVTDSGPIASVQFDLDGFVNFHTETTAAYALCGNSGLIFAKCNQLVIGFHTVTATTKGGTPFTVTFQIVDGTAPTPTAPTPTAPVAAPISAPAPTAPIPPPVQAPVTAPVSTTVSVTKLVLINSDSDLPIQDLTDGDTLSLSSLPTKNLNVQAVTQPGTVGSVVFGLDSNASYKTENGAPYALAGDAGGNYNNWTPSLGTHTVTATPYLGGSAGGALSVTFTVTA
jgi:hypothetical protein